jgi:N-acetylglucosamine-6-phosphate deacetylase
MTLALTNARLLMAGGILENHAVIIEGDRIQAICAGQDVPAGADVVSLEGAWLAPGFIDLQLNGCGGVLFNDDISADTIATMHATNLRSGCTAFLPTLITAPEADIRAALAVVAEAHARQPDNILGIHLEGPYINPLRKGIHNAAYIKPMTDAMVELVCEYAAQMPVLLTLAPEQNSVEHMRILSQAGVILSAGHSNATFEEARKGFDAGIRTATHLFNAMSPLEGRAPGLVGALLSEPSVSSGIIADGHHVSYDSIRLAHSIKGDRLYLVTDAVTPTGTDMTGFPFAGQDIYVRDGKCVNSDGTLSGAMVTLLESLQNVVENTQIALPEASRMCSQYPASVLGLADRTGRIAPGIVANLVAFDDRFNLIQTWDRGVPAIN